jgi:hypothetical protein
MWDETDFVSDYTVAQVANLIQSIEGKQKADDTNLPSAEIWVNILLKLAIIVLVLSEM